MAAWATTNTPNAFIFPAALNITITNSAEDTPGISTEIHDAARLGNWEKVQELLRSRPEAAAYVGENGWTALHHACNRRCNNIEMMRALIDAYPDALLVTENQHRWTPLHYACRFKAPSEAVRLLLSMYPEKGRVCASRPDKKDRLPLFFALRYDAPEGVVELLLEVEPLAALDAKTLAMVWDDWANKEGKMEIAKIVLGDPQTYDINQNLLINNFGIIYMDLNNLSDRNEREEKARVARTRLQLQKKTSKNWETINLLLKAAFGFPWNKNSNEVDSTESETGGSKWRVLHAVSAIKCHSSLFLLAIYLHPEQAFELDKRDLRGINNLYKSDDCNQMNPSNLTALHLAASSGASGDSGKNVLTQLLALNPDAAQHSDSEGSTPLHRIAGNTSKSDWNVDGVEDVYDHHKNAVKTEDKNGRLPLHQASCAITHYKSNVENDSVTSRSKICRLLNEYVYAAKHPDHSGCLPMHLVAKNGRTWDAQVQSLYDAYPEAIRTRAGKKFWSRLPLHFAAANPNSDSVLINALIRHHGIGARQADRKGMFPLHLACESGHSWEIVNSIYQTYPPAIEEIVTSENGRNALHLAAHSENSGGELIRKLAQLYPEAIEVTDSDGRCPLHLACMSGKIWDDGLSSLVNTFSSSYRDKNGLLPFHMIALRNSRMSTDDPLIQAQQLSNIYEMLKSYPEALK